MVRFVWFLVFVYWIIYCYENGLDIIIVVKIIIMYLGENFRGYWGYEYRWFRLVLRWLGE